jgi:hypothetical protein
MFQVPCRISVLVTVLICLADFLYQCCGSGYWIRCLFDPWIQDPGWVKSQPGSYFSELRNHFLGLKILKFLHTDPGGLKKFGSGMEKRRIRDPG